MKTWLGLVLLALGTLLLVLPMLPASPSHGPFLGEWRPPAMLALAIVFAAVLLLRSGARPRR